MLTIFAIIGIIVCLPIIIALACYAFVALVGLLVVVAVCAGLYVGADYVAHNHHEKAPTHATNNSHKR